MATRRMNPQAAELGNIDTISIPIRPLTGGMNLNTASTLTNQEKPEFKDLKNFIVRPKGLMRRLQFTTYGTADVLLNNKIINALTWWNDQGTQLTFFLTNRFLYSKPFSGNFSRVPWVYDEGTVSWDDGVSTTAVNGTATTWATLLPLEEIQIHDELIQTSETLSISAVDSDGLIIVEGTTPVVGTITDQPYEIHRQMRIEEPLLTDYTSSVEFLIFARQDRPLLRYNPSTNELEPFVQTPATEGVGPSHDRRRFSAATCAFFQDRLFVADITEWNGTNLVRYRQRVRWSNITNQRNFATPSAFTDLIEGLGSAMKLLPLANTLVMYFSNSIFVGRSTNIPLLPVLFQKIETGNIGLVGQRAVVSYLDGHFFVGQDDIYFMGNDGLQKVGTPIVQRTVQNCAHLWKVQAVVDAAQERVLFGFPGSSPADDRIYEVWSFSYTTGSWAYEEYPVATTFLANPIIESGDLWADVPSSQTWEDPESDVSWQDALITQANPGVYRVQDGVIERLLPNTATNDVALALPLTIETPDYDLGVPDTVKVFTQLSMKVSQFHGGINMENPLVWTVFVSTSRGGSWRNVGFLRIPAGANEGKVNFRSTSSHVRFRLTTESEVRTFFIEELTLQVRSRGMEYAKTIQGE